MRKLRSRELGDLPKAAQVVIDGAGVPSWFACLVSLCSLSPTTWSTSSEGRSGVSRTPQRSGGSSSWLDRARPSVCVPVDISFLFYYGKLERNGSQYKS